MNSSDELSDTHKRAELRGREAVARSRIGMGAMAARLIAAFAVVSAALGFIIPVVMEESPAWSSMALLAVVGGAFWLTAERMRRGSRVEACILLALLLLLGLGRVVSGAGLLGTIVLAAAVAAVANGVRGAFELARIERDESELIAAAAQRTANH